MSKRKWFILAALSLVIIMAAAGCGKKNDNVKDDNADSNVHEVIVKEDEPEVKEQEEIPEETPEEITDGKILIYIGNDEKGYKEYPAGDEDEVTPEFLIESMAELTGWNLSLSDEVASGKAGMTVMFSKDSALVTGPPENQKDEFRVADSYDLVRTILDSIQTTFRKNYVMEGGDESSFQVWFGVEEEDIKVEDLVISHIEPWDEQDIF